MRFNSDFFPYHFKDYTFHHSQLTCFLKQWNPCSMLWNVADSRHLLKNQPKIMLKITCHFLLDRTSVILVKLHAFFFVELIKWRWNVFTQLYTSTLIERTSEKWLIMLLIGTLFLMFLEEKEFFVKCLF